MEKQILFVLVDQFADWESAYLSSALYMLGQDQFDVKTVSLTTDSLTSIGGFHVVPDYSIDSIPSDYEALILIGGMTWRAPEDKIMEWYNFHKLGYYGAPMPEDATSWND